MSRVRGGVAIAVVVLAAVMVGCGSPDTSEPSPEPSVTPTAPSPTEVERLKLADIEEARVELSAEPDWLASGFGSVWTQRGNGSVVRISPQGKVQATIDADLYEPPVCQGIGVSNEAVWACATSGKIIRIDPETDDVVAAIDVPKMNEQGRLVSSGGQVWLLTGDGDRLTGLSEETNELGKRIELGTFCTEVADREVDGTLWVACASEGVVLRVDLEAGKVTGRVENVPLATSVSAAKDVWVGFDGGLARVDAESLRVAMVYEDVNPDRIRASDRSVWVREKKEDFLTRIDPADGVVRHMVAAKDLTSGGDVIEVDGKLWASSYDDGTIVRMRVP